ncbi:MAG: acylphosphatase, partial [Chloroflexi bacterium]|nr:acylphosphatase [Chloroflexota bacterium]
MQPNPNDLVRVHVWVKGRVQGVGFRAHVEYSAQQIGGITGWVRNVGYDTVEAV